MLELGYQQFRTPGFGWSVRRMLPLVLGLVGCAASGSGSDLQEIAVQSTQQPLWAVTSVKLWPGNIPVCFQPRPVETLGSAEWIAATTGIRAIVEQEYESIPGADIDFTGWETCSNSALGTFTNGIRVTVKINPNDTGAASWRHCGPGDDYPQTGCDSVTGYPDGLEGHIWYTYYGYPPGSALDTVILHEFGHALGFEHEYLRSDSDDCVSASSVSGDYITDYDFDSVLNATYCHWKGVLSYGDRLGLEVAYPKNFHGRSLQADHAFRVATGLVILESQEVYLDWFYRGLPGTAQFTVAGQSPQNAASVVVGSSPSTSVQVSFTDFKDRTHTLTGSSSPYAHVVKNDPPLFAALSMTTWM